MVDWYKLAVGASAISAANSLSVANQQNQELVEKAVREENRRIEISESRRLLQNIGSFIENIDNETITNESKLLSLMAGNFVMVRKNLISNAFDDMDDIKYASEINANYNQQIHNLSAETNSEVSNNLYNNFISSNFNFQELGFFPTVTSPFLMEICTQFGHIYNSDQYSIEINSTNYDDKGKLLNLNIKDYSIPYSLHIVKIPNSKKYKLNDSDGKFLVKFNKVNDLVYECVIFGIENSRNIIISLVHETKTSKFPKKVTIQTQEGLIASQDLPERILNRGDGYCSNEGCTRPSFRQTLYCYQHK